MDQLDRERTATAETDEPRVEEAGDHNKTDPSQATNDAACGAEPEWTPDITLEACGVAASGNASEAGGPETGLEDRKASRPPLRKFWYRAALGTAVCAAVTVVLLPVSFMDTYAGKTEFVLFSARSGDSDGAGAVLKNEVNTLTSPSFFSRVRRSLEADVSADRSNAIKAGAQTPAHVVRVDKWFSRSLDVSSRFEGDRAVVSVRLTGDDPALVKQALDRYTAEYVDYRRSSRAPDADPRRRAGPKRPTESSKSLSYGTGREIASRLERLHVLHSEYELALKRLGGEGVFRGFIPGVHERGVSMLDRFQERIVELEIKKRETAVRYNPEGREIATIRREIEGIRTAMRDYLKEQLLYVRRHMESLIAKQQEIERRTCGIPDRNVPPSTTNVVPAGRNWFSPREGLLIVYSPPTVERRSPTPNIAALADSFETTIRRARIPERLLELAREVFAPADSNLSAAWFTP